MWALHSPAPIDRPGGQADRLLSTASCQPNAETIEVFVSTSIHQPARVCVDQVAEQVAVLRPENSVTAQSLAPVVCHLLHAAAAASLAGLRSCQLDYRRHRRRAIEQRFATGMRNVSAQCFYATR